MTRRLFTVTALVLLLPAVSFAMAMCERGNKPKSALNYPDWPGLIDVVNDLSRESWCWLNGGEWLSYRGDTAALNRVLKEFSEVEAEELRVVLLPGPGRLHLLNMKDQDESKDPSSNSADWELHILQGLARGHVEHEHLEAISDMDPTLTVYVTERIDLNVLKIPERIKVLQYAELRERYENLIEFGDDRIRGRARRQLEELDAETPQVGAAAEDFNSRLTAIEKFVQQRK